MKKLSVLLITALLLSQLGIPTANAGIIANQKARIEQNRIQKSKYKEVKNVLLQQEEFVSKYDIDGLNSLYSENFINSDGFNKEIYFDLIKDTWKTYPDITYTTHINDIQVNENYASVYTDEIAVATSKENIGETTVVGELFSTSKCVYYLEKQGNKWLINSEKILEETSTLKYGDARYINMSLNAPEQIGSNNFYTTSLKVDTPKDAVVVASISNEKIIYPQAKSEDAFRKLPDDNILERVFKSNDKNVNEYAIASVAITKARHISNEKIQIYMGGLGFIMTRVNVIPNNKFIDTTSKKNKTNALKNKS